MVVGRASWFEDEFWDLEALTAERQRKKYTQLRGHFEDMVSGWNISIYTNDWHMTAGLVWLEFCMGRHLSRPDWVVVAYHMI